MTYGEIFFICQSLPVVRTSLYTQQPVKSSSKTEQGYSSGKYGVFRMVQWNMFKSVAKI
jgi:hypothetical protein